MTVAALTFFCPNCCLVWDEPFCTQCGKEHLPVNENDRPSQPILAGRAATARQETH